MDKFYAEFKGDETYKCASGSQGGARVTVKLYIQAHTLEEAVANARGFINEKLKNGSAYTLDSICGVN